MTYIKQQPNGGYPQYGYVSSLSLTNMDNGIYNAIDGVNGGTYNGNITLGGAITMTGSLVLPVGANQYVSGSTEIQSGGLLKLDYGSNTSVFGNITVSGTGAINVNSACFITLTGAEERLNSSSQIIIDATSSIVGQSGSNIAMNAGNITLNAGNLLVNAGKIELDANSSITFATGAAISGNVSLVSGGSSFNLQNGTSINLLNGSSITTNSGSSINANGNTYLNGTTYFNGTQSISGTTAVTGGSFVINSPATFNVATPIGGLPGAPLNYATTAILIPDTSGGTVAINLTPAQLACPIIDLIPSPYTTLSNQLQLFFNSTTPGVWQVTCSNIKGTTGGGQLLISNGTTSYYTSSFAASGSTTTVATVMVTSNSFAVSFETATLL